jgi:predicted NUDIX family NTP pyrophosphohydrolase
MARRSRKPSAGILLFRINNGQIEVLLAHPGSPFSRNADIGAWGIPKGTSLSGESMEDCARREFEEETGLRVSGSPVSLGRILQSGKTVWVWALEGNADTRTMIRSRPVQTVQTEFPIGSDRWVSHPEVDRCEWFDLSEARRRLVSPQVPFLDRLARIIQEAEGQMA